MIVLLEFDNLNVIFWGECMVYVINDFSLWLEQGEMLVFLGEFGLGKFVMLKILLCLLLFVCMQIDGGIVVNGMDVMMLLGCKFQDYCGGEVLMVFQELVLVLDLVYCIGDQIVEVVCCKNCVSCEEVCKIVLEML